MGRATRDQAVCAFSESDMSTPRLQVPAPGPGARSRRLVICLGHLSISSIIILVVFSNYCYQQQASTLVVPTALVPQTAMTGTVVLPQLSAAGVWPTSCLCVCVCVTALQVQRVLSELAGETISQMPAAKVRDPLQDSARMSCSRVSHARTLHVPQAHA